MTTINGPFSLPGSTRHYNMRDWVDLSAYDNSEHQPSAKSLVDLPWKLIKSHDVMDKWEF